MKSKNCVRILFGNVKQCNNFNAHYIRELVSRCDIICVNHNFGDPDLSSALKMDCSAGSRRYQELYRVRSTLLGPLFSKLLNLFKVKMNDMSLWYSYSRGNIYLENSSRVKFEIPDIYCLQKQSIDFWEFDVRSRFSKFKRLILGNVDFTPFCSINKQMLCVKSLRYSIKEVIWKNFICELVFNHQISFNQAGDNTISVDLSDNISFMIFGKFSNSIQLSDFASLFGHGELAPLNDYGNQSESSSYSNFIVKTITLSREDITYFISVFPVSKVIGPDFNDYLIPEAFLDMLGLSHVDSSFLSSMNSPLPREIQSPKLLKLNFYSDVKISQVLADPGNCTFLQIVSL
ncbi:hypothetical protein OJ253_1171 [Cryptosporidium canis]|uniref:Uncharacterized protein n=1 Tax=Cryptosporidium canis TaxID=195482 RepID=A0A9D5DJS3_9CRYT|nr:hypothetical protein OJ253_1171 [Cryptosporidium canis]